MTFISSMRLARVALSLAVTLWMAGAGCMLGCENMASAAANNAAPNANSLATIVSGDACASAHSHDCCAKRGAKSAQTAARRPTSQSRVPRDLELAGNTSEPMVDCPLAVNATAALSKSGADHTLGVVANTNATNPVIALTKQRNAFVHPLRLPNRGYTYLQCCVFLI